MLPKRWERIYFIAFMVALVGAYLLLNVAGRYEADEITKLMFGIGKDAPKIEAPVSRFALAMGVFYLLAALSAFIPRIRRIGTIMLVLAGLWLLPASLIFSAVGKQSNVLTMIAESLRQRE